MTPTTGQLNTSFDSIGCVGVLTLMAHLAAIQTPICEHLDISGLRCNLNFSSMITE